MADVEIVTLPTKLGLWLDELDSFEVEPPKILPNYVSLYEKVEKNERNVQIIKTILKVLITMAAMDDADIDLEKLDLGRLS